MATTVDLEVSVQDVEYQQQAGKPMLARIYQPQGTGPFPAIVDVHGGAWVRGDRTNDVAMNQALAARGIVVAAIDFRQPPEAGYPASMQDVNLGVRWLKANAGRFNASARVGSFGVSSGAHQVVLSAMRPHDSRYAALPLAGQDAAVDYVVACWPVIDPLYRFQYAQRNGRDELVTSHIAYWSTEAAMAEGNPVEAASKDADPSLPPVLLMLKEGDTNHPQEMQDAFAAAYRQRGGQVDMHIFKAQSAGPGLGPGEPEWPRVIDTMASFIKEHSR